MNEKPPYLNLKTSAEQNYTFSSEAIEMQVSKFVSDPDTYIVGTIDAYPDQDDEAGKINHLFKTLNQIFDELFLSNIVVSDPLIKSILEGGRDSEAAELGLYRLLKRAGLQKEPIADWLQGIFEGASPEEKLFQRGTIVKLNQVYSED